MKAAVLVVLALWPSALAALAPEALQGRWQGEGELVLGAEPAERLRCQVHLRPAQGQTLVFSGRCATAQGAQSFVYQLSEAAPGQIEATNRSEPADSLPARMQGTSDAAGLHLRADGGAEFSLVIEGEALRFVIAGHDSRGPARGEAILRRRE